MDMRQLYYFLEVAKHRNFTKAAKELHITQPTLSQQITKLEGELRVNLLVRSTRHVILTEAGQRFSEQAEATIKEWEKLNHIMGKYVLQKDRVLNIAMFPMAKMTSIMRFTTEFIDANPEIITEVRMLSMGDIIQGIQNGDYDVAFFQDSSVPDDNENDIQKISNLNLFPISSEPLGVLLNHNDVLAGLPLIKKQQLDGYQVICEKENSHNSYERICNVFRKAGVDIGQPIAFTYSPDMLASLLSRPGRAAFANLTIGLELAKRFPHLCFIPLNTNKKIDIYMAMRKEDGENKTAKYFFKYMKQKWPAK